VEGIGTAAERTRSQRRAETSTKSPGRGSWITGDLLLSLAILVGAIALWPITSQFRQVGRYQTLGPGFWPRVVLLGLMGLGGLAVGRAVWSAIRLPTASTAPSRPGHQRGRLLAVIVLCFGYVASMPTLGFVVGTWLFSMTFLLAVGVYRPATVLWSGLLVTATLFLLFIGVLNAPLPPGHGVFLALSRFLSSFVS
jgi:Tripartite tricarboxylate transporter TctB family